MHRETGVAKYIPLIKKEVKILLTGGVSHGGLVKLGRKAKGVGVMLSI
jgi:hypothetical protein